MILAPTLSASAGSGAAIARPTFSRDFAGEKTLNNGTGPAITFTRASNATFFDVSGVLQTASNNQPRFDHSGGTSLGLLIEEQRTNLLLNSASLSTQTVTVTATAHTLSFYGAGQIVLSGTHSATVTGSGAFPTRTVLTFTPSAGSLTLTVTGVVEYAQLEGGAFATSYIQTTGSSVTRSADVATVSPINSFYGATESTMLAEFEVRGPLPSARYVQFDDETNNNRIVLGLTSGVTVQNFTTVAGMTSLSATVTVSPADIVAGTIYKIGAAFAADNAVSARSGTLGTPDNSGSIPSGIIQLSLSGQPPTASTRQGLWLRRFAYWPNRLSDTLLQQLTI